MGWILFAAAAIALVLMVAFNPPQKGLPSSTPDTSTDALIPLKKEDKKISKENKSTTIDVTYPQFENVPAVINSDIKSFADGEVANIDELKLEEIPSAANGEYFLKANYEIEQANTNFVSLVFTVNVYTGGAHPNTYFRTFNYNVDTGTEMKLADLSPEDTKYLQKLKPKIKTAVHDSLEASLKEQGDSGIDADSILFKDIEAVEDEAFQNFTFGTDYIKFFFSPYDIAPYAAGPIVVKIER